ncbi:MAG: hypothetical protein M3139_06385 [Bacteroidota bacterium]|nr:hypothetical protein [Bacteroidota bacterium]
MITGSGVIKKKVAIRNAEHERDGQLRLVKSRHNDWDRLNRHDKNGY